MNSCILLAAGKSERMNGENKLIKEINGIPLIKYAVKNILGSAVDELIIVVGYEKEKIENTIEKNKKIDFVYNKDFNNGISSSIKCGLSHISKKEANAILRYIAAYSSLKHYRWGINKGAGASLCLS